MGGVYDYDLIFDCIKFSYEGEVTKIKSFVNLKNELISYRKKPAIRYMDEAFYTLSELSSVLPVNGRLPVLFSRLYLCRLIRYTFETSTNQFGFKMRSTDVKIRTLAPQEDGKRDDWVPIYMYGIIESSCSPTALSFEYITHICEIN